MRGRIRTVALVLLVLAAGAPAVAAAAVDTGSSCVTALHEEATEAGPLPSRLTSLLGAKGQRLLGTCTACSNYPAIAASFTTQVTQAFCGVASSVTVLNASAAPKPLTDPYKPYPYFTQCNVFNAKARAKLDLATVSDGGLTLSQATWLINAQQGVHATCWHAGQAQGPAVPLGVPGCGVARSAEQFRHLARHVLDRPQRYLLVNFSRATLSDDNQGGGHFSPLAAYNGRADDLLLMDVARYKYPPFWIGTDLLWQAMATTDTSSGRHRGFIVVEVADTGGQD
jgi:hypothetical protein